MPARHIGSYSFYFSSLRKFGWLLVILAAAILTRGIAVWAGSLAQTAAEQNLSLAQTFLQTAQRVEKDAARRRLEGKAAQPELRNLVLANVQTGSSTANRGSRTIAR